MAFKIEIRNPQSNKMLTFGPRIPGQVGKDILAVKIALGVIKKLEDVNPEFNEPAIVQGAEVPMDKQDWFNCQTGKNTDLETASTFDIHMQSVLKKYQMENAFLILSYFFDRRCIPDIISTMQEFSTIDEDKYKAVVERQVDKVFPLFEIEFGQLGEATLAIMHGWRPSSEITNEGFIHPASIYPGARTPVVSLMPENIIQAMDSSRFTAAADKMLESGYLLSRYPADPTRIEDDQGNRLNPAVTLNPSSEKLEQFKQFSRASRDWLFYNSRNQTLPFSVYSLDYKVSSSNTSRIYEPAISVLESTEEFSNPTLLDADTKEKRMKAFFYPNPFSTNEPFVIDTDKLGYFFETDYEIVADKLPSSEPGSLRDLEDQALEKIIEFYNKPKVWNFLYNDDQLNVVYLNDEVRRPEHSGVFPLEIDEDRVKNSSTYRAIGLKINLLEERIERLEQQLIPAPSNRHRDMESFEEQINDRVSSAREEIEALKQQRSRILSGEEFRKKDFWVLSTSNIASSTPEGSVQSWREVEVEGTVPLIKFVEFRTPPMRPGMKYRALMEINKEKLDLIIYGDSPDSEQEGVIQNSLTVEDETNTPNSEDLVRVCPSQSTEDAKRAYQELVAHARKKRREFSRSLKELTADRDTEPATPNIDLGFFGPYNFNAAFSGLHGLSGISNDYEYTTKALKLLVDSSSPLLEKLNLTDTAAEDLQQAINEGIEKSESGDRDSLRFNKIQMPWPELKQRITTAADDLSEAAKVIQREGIQFVRGSNYKPDSEAQLVRRLTTEIDQIIGDAKLTAQWGLDSERLSISEMEDLYKEDEIIAHIEFAPLDYDDLGPKNGKRIKLIKILIQEKNWFDFDTGIPNPIYTVSFDTASNADVISNYSALSRPRTVNYLSYIYSMTNPYPSSFSSFVKSFWDDGRSVCNELGIDSDKGLAISIVGNYTSGIQIDLSQDEDKLIEAFKDWSKKNFVNPTKKWLQQSGQNAVDSLNDTFDENAALEAFGKLCTLEDLYKEFMDKLDLKSLLCDYLRCLKLPAFEFKIPSFYLPPWPKIPIIGWYGYLVYFLVKQIKQILIRILCTFARTIIDKLSIPFCEEQLQDFISAGSSATPIMNKALAEALTNTGITSGNEQKAKQFFDDVANLTTGQELCRLLEGQPLDAAAMQMLRRLAEKQGLATDLDSDEAIVNYFGIVGAFVPFEVCDQLAQLPNADILTVPGETQQECDELLSALAAIRNRLLTGDSSITDEEIDAVLDIQKKNLNDRKAEMEALSGANFDVLLPPEFKPGTQQNQNTIINSMPTFLANTLQASADSLFMQAKSSYISGLSSYVQSMKVRGPASPTAFDSDYDYDSTLRLEASLEQIKNYTRMLQEESDPGSASAAAYRAGELSGIFEDAKIYGLGDWENPAALQDENYRFLNRNRNLENPEVRQENQRMIKQLLKKEFLNTLKVKQIISAFTIFEKFGHDPMSAYMKYSREIKKSIELTPRTTNGAGFAEDVHATNTTQLLEQYGLKEWWRVRPEGVGTNRTLEDAYDFVDHVVAMDNDDKGDWIRHGTDNAIRTFTLVTHQLRELPWYKNWAGLEADNLNATMRNNLEELQRIANFSEELGEQDQQTRTGFITQLFNQLDSLHSYADLEIFCEVDLHRQAPISTNVEDSYSTAIEKSISLSRGMPGKEIIRPSSQFDPREEYPDFGHSKKLNEFLESVVDSFYPEESEAANLSELYGNLSDINMVRTAEFHRRKGLFFGPKGSPLFLVNDSKGREFIPVPGFGNRVMTSLDDFHSSIDSKDTEGYDLFLPLENPIDFESIYPESVKDRAESYSPAANPLYRGINYLGENRQLPGANVYLAIEENRAYPSPAIGQYTYKSPTGAMEGIFGYYSVDYDADRDTNNSFRLVSTKSVLPINSAAGNYETIANPLLQELGLSQMLEDTNYRVAVGHPFHRRFSYGLEDITIKSMEPTTEQLNFDLWFDADVGDPHTSMKMYKAVVYGEAVLDADRTVHDTRLKFKKVDITAQGASNPHEDFGTKKFIVANSEYSAFNRSNHVYRMKSNNDFGDHQNGLGDEYDRIPDKWDPLMLRGGSPNIFDRDLEISGGTWGDVEHFRGGPDLDPLNPYAYIMQGANNKRPLLSAPVFFMLPNRALQYIPSHYTRAGTRDGLGPMTFELPTGYKTAGRIRESDENLAGRIIISKDEYSAQEGVRFNDSYRYGVITSGEVAFDTSQLLQKRHSYLEFLNDRRKIVNNQLYMKIVKMLCEHPGVNRRGVFAPLANKYLLKNFALDVLQKRIRIFERAMKIYGTKNNDEFQSIFEDLDLPIPETFEGFTTGAQVEITPEKVKTLFTPFELEEIRVQGSTATNLVHRRYYKNAQDQEIAISYSDFVDIIRDPLGVNWPRVQGQKVEFYFKPVRATGGYSELSITHEDVDMKFEKASGEQQAEVNDSFLRAALGNDYRSQFISKDLLYLKGTSTENFPSGHTTAKSSFVRTVAMLLLDQDKDNLIELAQLESSSRSDIVKAYANSGALLDIASSRVEELSGIILEVLQNSNQTFDYTLLPTISATLSLIKKSSPEIGEHVNLSYLGGTEEEHHNIGYRFGMLPYTPGIKMVEIPTTGKLRSDRYNIVVDSDINLGLSFKRQMKDRRTSIDRGNSEPMMLINSDNKNFRKIFSFCEELPQSLKSSAEDRSYSNTEARREIFANLVLEKLNESGALRDQRGQDPDAQTLSQFKQTIQKEVFDEVVSNLMGELTNSLQNSPMFDEEYAEQLETRVSGKPIVTETATGRCVSNRYSLESSSILSFKKVIIGDVFEEVMAEMSKPENSPFNRDFASPEPFDKAMKAVSVKAFIRLCLVDVLLKGGIAYSVWDVEPIVSTPLFFEYVKEHVRTELDKSKTLRSVWGPTLENSEAISNKMAALESVISKEIIKLPQYSKQIFNPTSRDKDYYNWFIYGRTMFDGEQLNGVSSTNKFFTSAGVIPRLPAPGYRDDVPRPIIGKTHLGNAASRLSNDISPYKKVFSTYRSYTKESTGDTPQPLIDTPTSKLIYEDYFRLSGKILDYLDGVSSFARPDSRTRRNPSTGEVIPNSFVVNFEEMTSIMSGLIARGGATPWGQIISQSEIKLGKRLCLYLFAGTFSENGETNAETQQSTIPELIRRIHVDDPHSSKDKASIKERAFGITAAAEIEFLGGYRPDRYASVPLTSYERDMTIEECQLISEYLQSEITPRNESTVPAEFYLNISEKFSETQGFKDYLEHLFPVRRYMTVSSLFSTAILGGFNEVPGILEPAKAMVAFVGMVCSTPPEKRGEILSIDQAEWSKMMRERSPGDMNEGDCFEFPGITEEFFREFWKELLKIMYYFPSILFRGIANVLDPAYKEMRSHYMNCDIRQLNWRGIDWYSTKDQDGNNKLTNGLNPGNPNDVEPNGKYAPIFPASISDFGIGVYAIKDFNFMPLLQATLKTVAYAYSGMLPFVDLSNAFKVPCADIDEDYGPGGKYDAGRYGRYGHPISPFTALALSTLQLPNDIERRKSACVIKESGGQDQLIPDADCDEQNEE